MSLKENELKVNAKESQPRQNAAIANLLIKDKTENENHEK